MKLKKGRLRFKPPTAEECQRWFDEWRRDYVPAPPANPHPLVPAIRPQPRKPKVPMRPGWHFHSNYRSGTLSPEYTEYLHKRGRTIHDPCLMLRNRIRISKGIKIKRAPVRVKLKRK